MIMLNMFTNIPLKGIYVIWNTIEGEFKLHKNLMNDVDDSVNDMKNMVLCKLQSILTKVDTYFA